MPCVAHPAKNMRGLEGIFFPLKMMLSYIIQNIKSHSSRKNTSNHNNMCIEYVFGSVSRLLHLCFLLSFSFSFFFFFFFFSLHVFCFRPRDNYHCSVTVQYCLCTASVLFIHCSNTVHTFKNIKNCLTVLFTYLKIILLQCFQFSVFSF